MYKYVAPSVLFTIRLVYSHPFIPLSPLLSSLLHSNSLYPSTLRSKIAYSNFKRICEMSPLFNVLCQHLKEGNVEFFHNLLETENTAFVFVVEAEFRVNEENVQANMDFCNFPYLRKVPAEDLSEEQAGAALGMGRNLGKEQPKLVTNFESSAVMTNLAENILYMIVFNDLRVRKVLKIISYKAYDYFADYISRLQDHRRDAVSPIVGKVLKSLGG